jgi:hypothetical protein
VDAGWETSREERRGGAQEDIREQAHKREGGQEKGGSILPK